MPKSAISISVSPSVIASVAMPLTSESTYDLFTAWPSAVGAPTLIIWLLSMSTLSPNSTASPAASVIFLPAAICNVPAIDIVVSDCSVSTALPDTLVVSD